nr:DivIVA domain-containing protein [Propionibacterium sp.]
MTLTIEQVRDCKFHLARRNGYEPVDVDNFVDKVEETLVALTEEISTLKQQTQHAGVAGDPEAEQALRRTLAEREAELEQHRAETERLRGELDAAQQGESEHVGQLRADLEAQQAQLAQLREVLAAKDEEIAALREQVQARESELDGLREQLAAKDGELEGSREQVALLEASGGQAKVERLVLAAAPEASLAVTRLLEMATRQADDLVSGAEAEASRRVEGAQAEADRIRGEADSHAERVRNEADGYSLRVRGEADEYAGRVRGEADEYAGRVRSEADVEAQRVKDEALAEATRTRNDAAAEAHRVVTEATQRRERLDAEHAERRAALDQEIVDRRNQLVGALDQEHGALAARVAQLRDFEKTFRDNFANQLSAQIENLRNAVLEPQEKPAILDEEPQASRTPRLDALLRGDDQQG